MGMDEKTDEQLIEAVQRHHGVPRGEALAALQEAWTNGRVEPPLTVITEIAADGKPRLVPATLSLITCARGPHVWSADRAEHLLWLVSQDLGEPAKAAPRRRPKGPVPGTTDATAQQRRALFPKSKG